MTIPLLPAIATLLEKVAVDNGFDRELPREGNWLAYASTQAPLRLWLGTFSEAVLIAAFSQANVARALAELGSVVLSPLPTGAVAARSVTDIPSMHRLVRRAFQLSHTLPDELLHAFTEKTAAMPRATEAERLVVQRVGQDIFRAGLLDYWDGRCAVGVCSMSIRSFAARISNQASPRLRAANSSSIFFAPPKTSPSISRIGMSS